MPPLTLTASFLRYDQFDAIFHVLWVRRNGRDSNALQLLFLHDILSSVAANFESPIQSCILTCASGSSQVPDE